MSVYYRKPRGLRNMCMCLIQTCSQSWEGDRGEPFVLTILQNIKDCAFNVCRVVVAGNVDDLGAWKLTGISHDDTLVR